MTGVRLPQALHHPRGAGRRVGSPARARVSRTRAVLLGATAVAAMLWSAVAWTAATLLMLAVQWGGAALRASSGADAVRGAPGAGGGVAHGAIGVGIAAAAALLAAAAALWRGRRARSLAAVALWMEEQHPTLRYALVTAADPAVLAGASHPALERMVARTHWRAPLARTIALAWLRPLAALAVLVVLRAALPAVATRAASVRPGAPRERGARPAAVSPLGALRVMVVPPAYSGRPRRTLADPRVVMALPGSALEVRGAGDGRTVRGSVRGAPVRVAADTRGWALRIAMPATPAALQLRTDTAERLIVLEPATDSVPQVVLTAPARDTVLRVPAGRLVVAAAARDDIGLDALWLELIVSSGTGERFTFRTATLARGRPGGAARGRLRAVLRLDTLRLAPGDLLHLRAVARDGNTITGPGTGASETRVVRIARAGEYDSVAVEAAPPPAVDSSAMSQRMLLLLTERLEAQRPRLARDSLVAASARLAADQGRLRGRVGDIIGQSAPGAANGPSAAGLGAPAGDPAARALRDAYNAMWDAERALGIAEPGRALPPMRLALAAIQRARTATRRYLQGRPPPVVVDVARVRLTGARDSVRAAPATARPPGAGIGRTRERLRAALELLARDRAAALDSLVLIRLDALGADPVLARVLDSAAQALRAGRDAEALLARVRWLAAGEGPARRAVLPRWGGAW